jgi:hypothetical protein
MLCLGAALLKYHDGTHLERHHLARLHLTEPATMHDRADGRKSSALAGGPSPLRLLLQSLPNPVVLRSACDDPLLQPRRGTRAGLPAMAAAVHDSVCAEQPGNVPLLVSRPLAPRVETRRR